MEHISPTSITPKQRRTVVLQWEGACVLRLPTYPVFWNENGVGVLTFISWTMFLYNAPQ